jgi:hypothetical protein
VQAVQPLGVVADHRVPEGLALHAGQPRRFRSREAIERVGERQEAHGGAAIRLAPRQAAKLLGGHVLADGERGHGGGPPLAHPAIPSARAQPTGRNFNARVLHRASNGSAT